MVRRSGRSAAIGEAYMFSTTLTGCLKGEDHASYHPQRTRPAVEPTIERFRSMIMTGAPLGVLRVIRCGRG